MRSLLSPVSTMTSEVRSSAVEQFQQLANMKRENLYELDIANVVTSSLNQPDKVAQRNFFQQERLQKSLTDLASVFSL